MSLCDTGHKHKELSFFSNTHFDQAMHCHFITKQQEGIAYLEQIGLQIFYDQVYFSDSQA